MKTLHLLRHAKSDRDDPSLDDHERPLAKRGIRAGEAIAAHLKKHPITVDRIYSSTARRTRETYALVEPVLSAPVTFRDELYLMDARGLLQFVRALPDQTKSVLMIGHDPGYHTLASMLAKRTARGEDEALAALKEKFPTGALASIAFAVNSWRDVAPGTGELLQFLRPRDLED